MPSFSITKRKPKVNILPPVDETRYEASRILSGAGIPSCLFMEDALQRHDIDTRVYDVWLLVPDIKLAADVLEKAGWKIATDPASTRPWMLWPASRSVSLTHPHAPEKTLGATNRLYILLRADQWRYNMPGFAAGAKYPILPPIPQLLDGLITMYLTPTEHEHGFWDFIDHLSPLIMYVYGSAKVARSQVRNEMGEEQKKIHDGIMAGREGADLNNYKLWKLRTDHIDRKTLCK